MSDSSTHLPSEQQALRAKCFHPSGNFVEFKREEVERSIPERFERMARKHRDRIAVRTKNHTLTYDALNRTANRVARAIVERCGEANEPIALLLENDAPMIAAILGVLKAGKMYVPLDTSYPRASISYILEDSQAGVIVTNSRNLPLAHELAYFGVQVVNVDEIDCNSPVQNPNLNISPESPVNILYTSGSTGQPKGVVQNHRNVLHEIMNYTNGVNICAIDRLILLSSPSFSGTVRTIYGALLNGGGLYLLDIREEGLTHLADWMFRQGITIYRSVPAIFRHFVSTLAGKERFPDLRLIYLAGDSVSKDDVELYKAYFSPKCIFVNSLGLSESLTCRWYFIDKETQIPGGTVKEVVVVARKDGFGDQSLVAYVVPHKRPGPTVNSLRYALKERLPGYMTPSAFVFLDVLPLTPNGKVDRRALPAPDQARPKLEETLVEPRNPIEEALARIWAQVLGLERVGVDDNFFDLGGHSLLATQVISRVREAYQVELSLRSLFETPTVAGLADAVQQAKESGGESPAPKISPASRRARERKWPL